MTIYVHKGDLPKDVKFKDSVAVDTETMGLNAQRDRLCLVQISGGDGHAHLVQIAQGQDAAPNLMAVLEDPKILKIFHFARFDVAMLNSWLNINVTPVYCTKIASRLARTFTSNHGLKDLTRDTIGVEISKQQQSSDWGAPNLTEDQKTYAASDVLYLHKIKTVLDDMLAREDRTDLAQACFDFISVRAALDLCGWEDTDIFAH